MIEMYHFWDSPCCFKVRMVLSEKEVEWTPRLLASVQFEHLSSEYQAINPHSIVPTLINGDKIIFQSNVIVEYLDEVLPKTSLTPGTAAQRALMRQWMHDEQTFLFPLIVTMSFNLMMKLREKAYGMEQLQNWSKKHPDQTRAQDYLKRVASPIDQNALDNAVAKFRWHMERMEKQIIMSGGPWICGKDYSLADISIAPLLDRIEYLDLLSVLEQCPRVNEWFERVKAKKSFLEAQPPFEYRMWGPKKPVPNKRIGPEAPHGSFPSK